MVNTDKFLKPRLPEKKRRIRKWGEEMSEQEKQIEKRKENEKMKKKKEKKPSNITVSDIALVFSIITLIIVIISNFVLK